MKEPIDGPLENTLPDSEFELGHWRITEEDVRRYLKAVGDTQQEYFRQRLVPPMALSALALGGLLEKLALAPGAIHSLQEVETLYPVTFGDEITGKAMLESPRRRGGLEFTTVSYTLTNSSGREVQTGKSTVLVPVPSGV